MNARQEGHLVLELCLVAGRVGKVRLASSRLTEVSKVLEAQPLDRALSTVPLLWSICATAHSVAALGAVEMALGARLHGPQLRAREVLALAEEAENHAWQLCLEWPRLSGGVPDAQNLRAVRAVTAKVTEAVFGRRPWRVPGGVLLRPDTSTVLEAADALEGLFAGLGVGPGLPDSLAGLRAWAKGASPAARLMSTALGLPPGDANAPRGQLLPTLPPEWFLVRVDDLALSRAPTLDGAPAETGALAQQIGQPLVADIVAQHGAGTLARLAARLLEVASLPAALRTLAPGLAPSDASALDLSGAGEGAGVVETSRGLLAHVVAIEGGRVVRWRTVAPTEWNFHPSGALALELTWLEGRDLPARAALAVAALDPCVGAEVRFIDADADRPVL